MAKEAWVPLEWSRDLGFYGTDHLDHSDNVGALNSVPGTFVSTQVVLIHHTNPVRYVLLRSPFYR